MTVERLLGTGLSSITTSPKAFVLNSTCTYGLKAAVGRQLSITLDHTDTEWFLAHLTAKPEWAEKMKTLLDKRDSLLEEAKTAPVLRRVNIDSNMTGNLLEVFR